jgi:hypothetical protein
MKQALRRAGPMPDLQGALSVGKAALAKIRAAYTPLIAEIVESTRQSSADADRRIQWTLMLVMGALLLAEYVGIRYLSSRRAVEPARLTTN